MSFLQTIFKTKGKRFFCVVERAWLPFGTTAAKGEGKKALLLLSAFPWKGGGKDILFVQKGGGKEGAHNSLCSFSLPLFPSPYSNSFPPLFAAGEKRKGEREEKKAKRTSAGPIPPTTEDFFFPGLTHYV